MDTKPAEETNAHDASEVAAHKAKSAQAAIEIARELQLAEAIEKSAAATRETVLGVFKEVFKEANVDDPEQMTVIHSKIPILCARVNAMDKKLDKLGDNQTWVVRIVIGAVILAVLKLVFIP